MAPTERSRHVAHPRTAHGRLAAGSVDHDRGSSDGVRAGRRHQAVDAARGTSSALRIIGPDFAYTAASVEEFTRGLVAGALK
ncbi:hypothetical protein [Jiangella asiatica]|uniref:Uncharacterized protein n=1 Tax=Jiangella asiatica TaxID=2530372 RepID=A0A4R5CT29_9ACTN|nr:hypothetical protein [Jiangella asiatica]TDE02550.1 hypothetical protein E1269_21430 [Jiangella asiatica]